VTTAALPDAVAVAAADGLAEARRWLLAHPAVERALGGPNRVGPYNEPPYPRVRLTQTPGGSLRGARWIIQPQVQIEVLGDRDGTLSPAALTTILLTVMGALAALPEQEAEPGRTVVTAIEPDGGFGPAPLATGQPRAVATATMTVHPPQPILDAT
jgi:hypothetical protein